MIEQLTQFVLTVVVLPLANYIYQRIIPVQQPAKTYHLEINEIRKDVQNKKFLCKGEAIMNLKRQAATTISLPTRKMFTSSVKTAGFPMKRQKSIVQELQQLKQDQQGKLKLVRTKSNLVPFLYDQYGPNPTFQTLNQPQKSQLPPKHQTPEKSAKTVQKPPKLKEKAVENVGKKQKSTKQSIVGPILGGLLASTQLKKHISIREEYKPQPISQPKPPSKPQLQKPFSLPPQTQTIKPSSLFSQTSQPPSQTVKPSSFFSQPSQSPSQTVKPSLISQTSQPPPQTVKPSSFFSAPSQPPSQTVKPSLISQTSQPPPQTVKPSSFFSAPSQPPQTVKPSSFFSAPSQPPSQTVKPSSLLSTPSAPFQPSTETLKPSSLFSQPSQQPNQTVKPSLFSLLSQTPQPSTSTQTLKPSSLSVPSQIPQPSTPSIFSSLQPQTLKPSSFFPPIQHQPQQKQQPSKFPTTTAPILNENKAEQLNPFTDKATTKSQGDIFSNLFVKPQNKSQMIKPNNLFSALNSDPKQSVDPLFSNPQSGGIFNFSSLPSSTNPLLIDNKDPKKKKNPNPFLSQRGRLGV